MGISDTYLHLKRKKKKIKLEKYAKSKRPDRLSIENRPDYINNRESSHHWEMDTVVSGQTAKEKAALLVMTERKPSYSLIRKLEKKSQNEVIRILDNLEKQYQNFSKKFKSITMDNGSEFLDYKNIERSLFSNKKRTTTYYCHPYSAYERGANENINRMIRYFIPKGANIADYSEKDIQLIEDWINNYPRAKFGGLSAFEVCEKLIS